MVSGNQKHARQVFALFVGVCSRASRAFLSSSSNIVKAAEGRATQTGSDRNETTRIIWTFCLFVPLFLVRKKKSILEKIPFVLIQVCIGIFVPVSQPLRLSFSILFPLVSFSVNFFFLSPIITWQRFSKISTNHFDWQLNIKKEKKNSWWNYLPMSLSWRVSMASTVAAEKKKAKQNIESFLCPEVEGWLPSLWKYLHEY